ncbi:MAG: GT2 family glycosyltransferase [Psychroserpens sp.]|jgi:GT2 family glycosyltransferase
MYSRNLQKSGFFYGFPSRKKLDELYAKNVIKQQSLIDAIPSPNASSTNILILVPKSEANTISVTLSSLPSSISLHVVCWPQDIHNCQTLLSQSQHATASLITAPVSTLASQGPVFVIYAGNVLHPDILKLLQHYCLEESDVLFCDTDNFVDGKRQSPVLLPDWNPDLQLSTAGVSTGVWFKNAAFIPTDFTCHAEAVALWLAELYLNDTLLHITHMPLVLVHSTQTLKFSYRRYAEYLNQMHPQRVSFSERKNHNYLAPTWSVKSSGFVSLVVPTKDAKGLVQTCIDSMLASTYQNFEILLIDNNSTEKTSLEYFSLLNKHPKIRVLPYPKPFNYSSINNFAVEHAKGDIIGLINNDIEAINKDWLTYMVGHVERHDIGCVGAKLLYPDDRVQHAGVVMGYGGGAGHAHKYFPRYHPGYIKRLAATNNYSAVTAACLLVKKADYLAIGGLNESLSVAFNDVDFCLRIRQLGRRNLFCAEAELYHHESATRGHEDTREKLVRFEQEVDYLQTTWADIIQHDPCYNPNLTLRRENFSIKENSEY